MKIFFGSLVIFFATLLAAGLVALGQPGDMGVALFGFGLDSGLPAEFSSRSGWDSILGLLGLR